MIKYDYMEMLRDTFMLLSYVNTKLRDEFDGLESLCLSLGWEREELLSRLSAAGYVYHAEQNKFISPQ